MLSVHTASYISHNTLRRVHYANVSPHNYLRFTSEQNGTLGGKATCSSWYLLGSVSEPGAEPDAGAPHRGTVLSPLSVPVPA